MNDKERAIREALIFFGPMTLRDIHGKLDLRGIVLSQVEIEKHAESLVKAGLIKRASGFNDIAYKA